MCEGEEQLAQYQKQLSGTRRFQGMKHKDVVHLALNMHKSCKQMTQIRTNTEYPNHKIEAPSNHPNMSQIQIHLFHLVLPSFNPVASRPNPVSSQNLHMPRAECTFKPQINKTSSSLAQKTAAISFRHGRRPGAGTEAAS